MKLLDKYEKHEEIYKAGFLFDPEAGVFFTDKLIVPKPKGYDKFSDEEKEQHEKFVISKTLREFKNPEGYEDWSVELLDVQKYGNQRLEELGVNKKNNFLQLIGSAQNPESIERLKEQIFTVTKRGEIEILQYGLDRRPHYADKNKDEDKGKGTAKGFRYYHPFRTCFF